MKKAFALILTLVLALSLAGCGGATAPAPAPAPPEPAPAPSQPLRLLMVTGGTAGTYFAYGGVIATTLTANLDNIEITANTSGASVANVRSLNNKEAELAVVQNDVLYYAFNGVEMLADDGSMPTLRTIATLYPEVIQVVALESAGISSIADLKGKRVCIGDAGSGTEANARQVLAAFGLSFSDLGQAQNLSFADAATAMQNGTLDASFTTAGVPNPAIMELSGSTKIVVVPIDGPEVEGLIADYPFYGTFTISDEAYSIPGGDTVAVLATLACIEELSEDAVYEITKGLFAYQEAIAAGHARGNELSAEYAVVGVGTPFHPGAEKYYKEAGVID